MAGTSSFQSRSSFVAEVTAGTTPATPAFKTLHAPALFTGETDRMKGISLTAGGANFGDALMHKPSIGEIKGDLIYGLYDPLWESLLQGSWSSDVLTDGKDRKTMTFETSFPAGEAGTTTYFRQLGVEAVSGQLVMNSAGRIDLTFGLRGMQSEDATTTAITGATYTAPTNKEPFSAEGDVGAVTLSGLTLPGIATMTIDYIYEGRAPQPKIGSSILAGVTRGAFRPKITIKAYIDSAVLSFYNAARNLVPAERTLTVDLGSVTLKKYRQYFPTCTIDMAPTDLSQPTGFQTITITPQYNLASAGVMVMTRALA